MRSFVQAFGWRFAVPFRSTLRSSLSTRLPVGPGWPTGSRWFVLGVGLQLYVIVAALQRGGPLVMASLALLGGPLALLLVWRRTETPGGLSPVAAPAPLSVLRLCVWGAGTWLCARVGGVGVPGFNFAASFGLGVAASAGALSLARIPAAAGLADAPAGSRALDAPLVCGAVWGLASSAAAYRAVGPWGGLAVGPLATDYATSVASVATMLVLCASALRLRHQRRFELGVADRGAGALSLCVAALGLSVPAALAGLAPPDRALPAGAAGAAIACAWASSVREAASIPATIRAGLLVVVFGAPAVLLTSALVLRAEDHAGVVALAGGAVALAIGASVHRMARPLSLESSRWLSALERACQAALEPEPRAAIEATLVALQGLEKTVCTQPELFGLAPPRTMHVDRAGYLHESAGEAPPSVYDLAREEPERLLRFGVLQHAHVRRPPVRSAHAWMSARDAYAAVLVRQGGEDYGLLVVPRGTRESQLSLEEARALGRLAERLGSVLSVSAALGRAAERERAEKARAAALQAEKLELSRQLVVARSAQSNLPNWLAYESSVATYSARAQQARAEVEAHARGAARVLLSAPIGTNAVAWAVRLHLLSGDEPGPLIVVDATRSEEQSESFWTPSAGPFAQAEAGTLVVLHANCLPAEALERLALAPQDESGPRRVVAIAYGAVGVAGSVALALGASVVRLPSIEERPEDVRGLVLEGLCRSGFRHRGAEIGIEPAALALLVEYEWPGNEAELRQVVSRAASLAQGPRVGVGEVLAAGLPERVPEASSFRLVSRRGPSSREPGSASGVTHPPPDEATRPRRRRRR